MSTIHLSLLGPFEISPAKGGTLRRKERALLAYLAVQTRPLLRQTLTPLFFAQAEDPAAALRLSLSRLRRTLGSDIFLTESRTVQWNPSAGMVDYAAFVPMMNDYAAHSADALTAALALYRGEFLAGLALEDAPEAELWLLQERAHVQVLYERGALELIRRWRLAGQWDAAIQQTRTLLTHSPLLEPAHEHLLWLYHQTGQPDAAQAHYETYRQLALGVGITPTLDFRQTVEAVPLREEIFSPERARQSPFAGREAELRALHTHWQNAQKGQGRFILLEGEAGAGKSTLVTHFARQFALPLLTGNSYETAQHLPYTPWIELLEHALNATSVRLSALPAYTREAFAKFLPGWGSRLGIAHPGQTLATDGQEATSLFQAFTDGLFALFEGETPLIFLDNLQWADEASLGLLHFAARRAVWRRWLIIGAHRPGDRVEWPALGRVFEGLSPRVERLPLSGLTASAIADLAASLWPQLPAEARADWAARLAQATGGNPFFVCELFRELSRQGTNTDNLPVPTSVRELVQQRMQFLSSGGQVVLGALAVLDAPATPARLHKICERQMGETLDVLDESWQRGLLQVDGESYGFAHDLVREAVWAGLSPARQRWLHERAAETLASEAEAFPVEARGELAGRVLQHALAGDDPVRVFAWGHEAAQYALRLNAIRDAYQAIEAALAAFPRVQGDESHERHYLRLLLDSAGLISRMGQPLDEERKRLEQALALLARYPEPDLRALYHLREASLLSGEGRYAEAIPAALNAFEYYMDLEDSLGAARSLHSAGRYQITLSQNQAGRALFTQALEHYQACGNVNGEVSVMSNLAWVDLNMGEPGQALHGLAQALELARQAGDMPGQAEVCNTLAAAWNYFYRADRVQAYAQEAFNLFDKLGLPNSRARIYLGTAAWVRDGLEAAREEFLHTYEETIPQNDLWLRGWAAQLLGRVAFEVGDWNQAKKWLEEATQLRIESGEQSNQISDLGWLGRLRLAQGQVDAAAALTEQAVKRMTALSPEAWVFEKWDVYRAHAAVLMAKGETAAAAQYNQLADEAITWMAAQAPDDETREGFLSQVHR